VILKYGTHAHAAGECEVVIEKQPLLSERGQRHGTRERWHINGMLGPFTTQAEVTTAINTLLEDYSLNDKDLILYLENGTTESSHFLKVADTLGGVRVTGLNFPQGRNAEYARYRTYTITVEADFAYVDGNVLAWVESLTFAGGGSRFRMLPLLNGPPQKQIVNLMTPFSVVQEGSAVGKFTWPSPAFPLWPGDFHTDQSSVKRDSPDRVGPHFTNYRINWRYIFESAAPMNGDPTTI
jgi:hypothetical protein